MATIYYHNHLQNRFVLLDLAMLFAKGCARKEGVLVEVLLHAMTMVGYLGLGPLAETIAQSRTLGGAVTDLTNDS